MSLIAIDPGTRTGWAVFKYSVLVLAGVEKNQDLFRAQEPRIPGGIVLSEKTLVVVELPQHVKVPVMDLITLAVLVGEVKRFYEGQGCDVERVWPTTWKHSVPKEIHNKRVLAALTPNEVELLPRRPRAKDYDHNLLDAVGLGLWKLGRLR